jgi:hypothetical protein
VGSFVTVDQRGAPLSTLLTNDLERCRAIGEQLTRSALYTDRPSPDHPGLTWRISPTPFWITETDVAYFEELGRHLHAFYRAVNQLYHASRKGQQPDWVCGYLDQGKPDTIIDYGRMNRFKQALPGVIRPDLIPTHDWGRPIGPATGRLVMTELDSVPGGIGLTAALAQAYAAHALMPNDRLVGGATGMVEGFAAMIRAAAPDESPLVAIVVSEESRDYRAEMVWLAEALGTLGLRAVTVAPEEVRFTERQLECEIGGTRQRIDVLYRFFELFDLKNIPKAELLLYGAKKGLVALTPPPKSYLEEKLLFALFHHPALQFFWQTALPPDTLTVLDELIPPTWILDPRPLPPHAVIPDLSIDGQPVNSWDQVAKASQKGRHLVLKPSGFSPLAWGSRGVSIGHDLSQEGWAAAVEQALAGFSHTPSVLQPFAPGRSFVMPYLDPSTDRLIELEGRVRLSPYYFVTPEAVRLGGILATLCPMDKKILHGMSDAILAPCAVRRSTPSQDQAP